MAIDRFAFYAKNYRDIGHLVKLDEDVRETYPAELWNTLQRTFTDAFQADSFAGLSGWECDDQEDGPDDWFSFWNRRHYDSEKERGSYFSIGELTEGAQRVESIERAVLAPLVTCSLAFWGTKGPGGVTAKKLTEVVTRATAKLKKAGFKESPEAKGCYVRIDVGDLVHISTLGKQQQNFAELIKRVEKLVRACIPVIERAAQNVGGVRSGGRFGSVAAAKPCQRRWLLSPKAAMAASFPRSRRPSNGMSTRPRSPTGDPMTLGNMRSNGVRSLDVSC